MSRSERVTDDACGLQERWTISPVLAVMLVQLEAELQQVFSSQGLRWPGLFIISGYRSPTLQDKVNPSAPNSRHTICPSMAVDLRMGDEPASITPRLFWEIIGSRWIKNGGRWGGTFNLEDLNHFDLG